jgi:hypothetical protein
VIVKLTPLFTVQAPTKLPFVAAEAAGTNNAPDASSVAATAKTER